MLYEFVKQLNKMDVFYFSGEKMAVDHIFPKDRIKRMDGYDELTENQKRKLLNDEYGLGNLQPLPSGLNSSKRDKIDWDNYKGEPLHPDYSKNLQRLQRRLEDKIQNKIYELIG